MSSLSLFRFFRTARSSSDQAKQRQPSERIFEMELGPCLAELTAGEYSIRCPCPAGKVRVESGGSLHGDTACIACSHPISQHQNVGQVQVEQPSASSAEPASGATHSAALGSIPPASLGGNVHSDVSRIQPLETPAAPRPALTEPVNLGQSTISRREITVSKLAELIEEQTVVHVRGTPSSGKTILAKLLQAYYDARAMPCVFLTGWCGDGDPIKTCIKLIRDNCGRSIDYHSFFGTDNNTVFIIDEAQTSYTDEIFWLSILKTQSGRVEGPRFCLFSSYGSPSTGLSDFGMVSTPLRLAPGQRVSLMPSRQSFSPDIGLFYTKDEFDDVVKRWISLPSHSPFSLHGDASAYLFSITNGHSGAVAGLLAYIYATYRADIKHHRIYEVGKSHVLQALEDDAEVFNYLTGKATAVARSFPSHKHLSVEAADALRRVLADGSIPFDEKDPGINLCYRMGWLHADAIGAGLHLDVWYSLTAARFVEVDLDSDYARPFPIGQFPTLAALCQQVLKNFSKNLLQRSAHGRVSTSGKLSNPEAQFQDEFYRSFTALIPHVSILSEWSRNGDGRIDFRIPELGWGIELLRDGDRLADHCGRFTRTGAYGGWIQGGQLKDWLIIDCRHSDPKRTSQPEPKLWRAIFKDEYTKALVLHWNNEIIIHEFPLREFGDR